MAEDAQAGGSADVARWLAEWGLVPDGAPFSTPSSVLAPVRLGRTPAMLKVALVEEERVGNHVMAWWGGNGGARVLRHDGEALLLQRAQGSRSLAALAAAGGGHDDDATRVLCTVAATLHEAASTPEREPPAGLRTLEDWFRDLLHTEAVASPPAGGFYAQAADLALELLADQREVVVLHGDLHHGNVLDFGSRGWRAIDPKGIVGDRAFDFANILCNPNAEVALRPGRLSRQVGVIADAAGVAPDRLLRWTVAWCGLSATWSELDNQPPGHTLSVGLAAERLLAGGALGG